MTKQNTLTKKDIQELLDFHLKGVKKLMGEQTVIILNAVDEKIKALDLKFSQKFDRIMTALDKYSQRTTTLETEFTMIKNDLNRVKKVLKEKLGVEL